MRNLDFGEYYSVLSPFKCAFHSDRMSTFLNGQFYDIKPVTVHLVPTLRCNHQCFFCTYGGLKDTEDRMSIDKTTMSRSLIYKTIDQLAENGVKGVIFSGGGEPTLYAHLTDAMKYCIERGMEVAINTNGHFIKENLIHDLIKINPTYIRISLNSGSGIVQKLTTGVDDFKLILENIEKLIFLKREMGATTDISIGYVVNVLNVNDLRNLAEVLLEMEEKMYSRYSIENGLYSLQIRPVSNYENSKHIRSEAMKQVASYLKNQYGESYEKEYYDFMLNGAQCSTRVLKLALNIIENDLIPRFQNSSNIKIVYPRQKYLDLIDKRTRSYDVCLSCPGFFLSGQMVTCTIASNGLGLRGLKSEIFKQIR